MQSVETYDYVVIGAGTAGCVLATRLSEDGDVRVLLLEAGSAEPLEAMGVPAAWPTLLQSTANWGDVAVENAATGTSIPLGRGRGLGGSSSINAMAFVRGHRTSYDAWVKAGAKGWGFDDLLPYFRRSENADRRDPAFRGVGGPLTVRSADPLHPVAAAGLEAAVQAGHRRAGDISGGQEEGFGAIDLNVVGGRRQSAADAYLRPVLHRPNLDVVTGALVHRVLVENGRCVGVEYRTDAGVCVAACSREVVLSAGAVGSAQVLMQSGIGPAAHLRDVGVEVLLDLPGVGGNLHDHPIIPLVYAGARPVPATGSPHGEVIGMVRSPLATDGPDLQLLFVDIPYAPGVTVDGYTIVVSPMLPRSRGTVRLSSAEPGARPLIDPNHLGDEHDLATTVAGMRMAREIGRAAALDPWRGVELHPGPDVSDDAALRAYARRSASSYFHLVGTCRIGEDEHAVVDTELRVRGIDALRVADGSVIPSIPSANTNATVYAIAERAADLLTR